MNQVDWQRRRDILRCVICFGIIIWAIWLLVSQFVEAIFLLLLSMAVAFLITPAVNMLTRWRIPRLLAAIIVYLIVLAAIVGFSYALIFSLISQVQNLSTTVQVFIQDAPTKFSNFINFIEKQGQIPPANVDAAIGQIQGQVTNFAKDAVQNALNILLFITQTFLNFLIVIVVSFYLTLDGTRIRDSLISIVPRRSLPHVLLFEDSLNRVVGNYIRGQLTLALIIGVLTSVVCLITGLGQFALIFGILGFLFETIPMIGPFLASISPILTSMLLGHPFTMTLEIVVLFIIIQAIESNVLGPRIVGHAVGLHPVASILALLVFAHLFSISFGAFGGAIGALVATPIIAATWVVIASIYRSMRGETPDQILARKRAPWTLHRPSLPSSIRFRPPTGWGRGRTSTLPAVANTESQPEDEERDDDKRVFDESREDVLDEDHGQTLPASVVSEPVIPEQDK